MSTSKPPALTVHAVRYCADVAVIADFFRTLGLSPRIRSESGGFVDLVAGEGLLMLHRAGNAQSGVPAGDSVLSFETSDLEASARALADLEPIRWDESYGRHLGIRDVRGDGIWINESQRDMYGYRAEPVAPNDLNLLAVRETADFGADTAFYRLLGFEVRDGASEDFAPLDGTPPSRGVVGLHPPFSVSTDPVHADDDPMSPPARIRLGFETHEPLDELADRLTAAGIEARRDDNGAPHVVVVDPDGQEIEIHVAP